MMKKVFDVAMHEEYGTLGLRPKWFPNGDPLSGMAAAHDVLEHFPDDDGSTEGELMALGASLFVRGDGGVSVLGFQGRHVRYYDETRDTPADFPMIWDLHTGRDSRTSIRPCTLTRDIDVMRRARMVAREGCQLIRSERLEAEGCDYLFTPEDEEHIARWLARGYMRTKRRYRLTIGGACGVAAAFTAIEKECDARLKHAEEGQELTVYVNLKRAHVRVTCAYPGEMDYDDC